LDNLELEAAKSEELCRIIDRYFFTTCWEFIQTLQSCSLNVQENFNTRGATETYIKRLSGDVLHLVDVVSQPCPGTLMELREALEDLDDPDLGTLTDEEIDALEQRQWELEAEVEALDSRAVMQYWIVSKDIAQHYGWSEIDIVPPVTEMAGLWVWVSFYTSISDDWFLEKLVEHICTQRLIRSSS
tara:strand:+ start:326 stop:883 length:558 start_codon:yes stop_codon:yes gene_type:complete